MKDPELIYITEPNLTFGYGQKASDPRDGLTLFGPSRDGLTLFGPFLREKIIGQVNIGVIGPRKQREYLISYLKRIHKPIFGQKKEIARPFFPGLESIFGVHINFNNVNEIDVPENDVFRYLHYEDGHQRVHNLTNLYTERLEKYSRQEEIPVVMWFVVIPDDVYKFGRPNSKIPKSTPKFENPQINSQHKNWLEEK